MARELFLLKSTSTFQPKLLLDTAPHPHTCFTSEIPTHHAVPADPRDVNESVPPSSSGPNPFRFSFSNPFISSALVADARLNLRGQNGVTPYHGSVFGAGK